MCFRSKIVIPELKNRCDKLEMEVPELMLIVQFLSEKVSEYMSIWVSKYSRESGSCFGSRNSKMKYLPI
ncbi:hypothetical protein BUALT_Bualt06G0030300 [Buddleja alternifolia]|uniref:Uncharacterized protein n=1 Tax=Buddleja alternifolia TaxID=168488 RepID=A0AAV6XNE6_9LAMI|nr:hypothetical protein BUALT_Bualt06G0030300 [Buddleja alternifolia]